MTEPTYAHGEAFCLMTYQADDGETELIWNSRDGVTPFVITLRSGKSAMHADWRRDLRKVDYQPPLGSRIFIDMTEEAARTYAKANAEKWWNATDDIGALAKRRYESVEAMTDMLAGEYYKPGAPDLIVVTG